MVLSNDILKNFIVGAVEFDEKTGIIPFRFAMEKINAIVNNENRLLRHKTGAGIKIDFFTNAEKISFGFKLQTPCANSLYNYYYFDVYVDNNLILHQGEKNVDVGFSGNIEISLNDTYKRITIYLPCQALVEIFDFSLSNGAIINKVEYDKHVLFLGDSITHNGYLEYPSMSYTNILARKLNYSFVNQAIGGDIFSVKNLEHTPNSGFDTVFVAYGTNDWTINSKDTAKNIEDYFKALRNIFSNTQIIAILPIWRKDKDNYPEGALSFSEIRNIIKKIGESFGVKVIDGFNFVPSDEQLWWDGYLHPNEKGFEFYERRSIQKNMAEGTCTQECLLFCG